MERAEDDVLYRNQVSAYVRSSLRKFGFTAILKGGKCLQSGEKRKHCFWVTKKQSRAFAR